MPLAHKKDTGLSLLEVMIAFLILVIAVLTMVGYTTTIHRASVESKRQAIASLEARSVLEILRDSEADFVQAASPSGYSTVKTEYLLDSEADPSKNESGRKAAAHFAIEGRAAHIAGDIYSVTVTARWTEDQRPREVVLESRAIRPGQ